jgi:hypothetical protein
VGGWVSVCMWVRGGGGGGGGNRIVQHVST